MEPFSDEELKKVAEMLKHLGSDKTGLYVNSARRFLDTINADRKRIAELEAENQRLREHLGAIKDYIESKPHELLLDYKTTIDLIIAIINKALRPQEEDACGK